LVDALNTVSGKNTGSQSVNGFRWKDRQSAGA